jgi:hypothetical protein
MDAVSYRHRRPEVARGGRAVPRSRRAAPTRGWPVWCVARHETAACALGVAMTSKIGGGASALSTYLSTNCARYPCRPCDQTDESGTSIKFVARVP